MRLLVVRWWVYFRCQKQPLIRLQEVAKQDFDSIYVIYNDGLLLDIILRAVWERESSSEEVLVQRPVLVPFSIRPYRMYRILVLMCWRLYAGFGGSKRDNKKGITPLHNIAARAYFNWLIFTIYFFPLFVHQILGWTAYTHSKTAGLNVLLRSRNHWNQYRCNT